MDFHITEIKWSSIGISINLALLFIGALTYYFKAKTCDKYNDAAKRDPREYIYYLFFEKKFF